jgi:hypothetical protein
MVQVTHQEASTVVRVPLTRVEQRLRDIESWERFLAGVSGVRRTAHERYVFRLDTGRSVPVAVRAHPRQHSYVWCALAGPPFDGTLRLSPRGRARTRVTLSLTTRPVGFLANLLDMVAPSTSRADIDVQQLASFVDPRPGPGREHVAARFSDRDQAGDASWPGH